MCQQTLHQTPAIISETVNDNIRISLASFIKSSQPLTLPSQTIATQSATVHLIKTRPLSSESTISLDSITIPFAVSTSYVLTIITTVSIEGSMASSESLVMVFEGYSHAFKSLTTSVVNAQTLIQGGMISIGSIPLSLPHSASSVVEGTLGISIPSGTLKCSYLLFSLTQQIQPRIHYLRY